MHTRMDALACRMHVGEAIEHVELQLDTLNHTPSDLAKVKGKGRHPR